MVYSFMQRFDTPMPLDLFTVANVLTLFSQNIYLTGLFKLLHAIVSL